MKIATESKRRWREGSFGRSTKKVLWNSVHDEPSYKRSCWPTLSRQCAFGVYQCIWVWATWLWWRGNFTPPNFPQSDLGRRADSRWALLQISSFSFIPSHTSEHTDYKYAKTAHKIQKICDLAYTYESRNNLMCYMVKDNEVEKSITTWANCPRVERGDKTPRG